MKLYFPSQILIIILTFVNTSLFAQKNSVKTKNNLYLNTFVGYGTENNWGNTAFFGGATLSKPIKKHLFLEGGLTLFTTALYNVYKDRPTGLVGQDRYYHAVFLTPDINYTFGSKKSFLNASIKIGPSLKYQNDKILKFYQERVYPDGHSEVMPGSVQYYYEKGFNISYYAGVSFDAKITDKLRVGIFLDTYSHAIFLEHFMPGINAVFKL
ncbi:MAG: hypothetical protein V5804_02630 [Mucilaginibacter sp.]|uniref:hypothetical protein n=1 Tax=Mucilaginibacter sp. TaxID=1882438 RepID=UPI0034E3A4EE